MYRYVLKKKYKLIFCIEFKYNKKFNVMHKKLNIIFYIKYKYNI